jgi:hypothetical protein
MMHLRACRDAQGRAHDRRAALSHDAHFETRKVALTTEAQTILRLCAEKHSDVYQMNKDLEIFEPR